MKIAFLFSAWGTGGRPLDFNNIWTSQRGLTGSDLGIIVTASEMVKKGHDTTLFTVYSGEQPATWQGVKLRNFAEVSPVSTEDFDVVISWSEPDVLRLVSNKPLRVVCQMLNDFSYCQPGFDSFVDVWTSPCQMLLDHLLRQGGTNPNKWHILPLGCEPSWYKDGPRVPGRVIWTSSADRGLHILLGQWPKIKAAVPEAHLRVFYNFNYDHVIHIEEQESQGGGARAMPHITEMAQRARYMLETIKKLKSLDVDHVGSVSRERMAQELNEAMVLAYSFSPIAFTEGFSVSLLESCAAGVVPVTSDGDCLGSVYGGVVPMVKAPIENNLEEFNSLVVKGLVDNEFRDTVRKQCKSFAYKHTWTESANKLENIIKDQPKYRNNNTIYEAKDIINIANKDSVVPEISIIMPTMRIGGLDVVFESLKHQTFKNFEIIIVDSIYHHRKYLVSEAIRKYNIQAKHIEPTKNIFPISNYCNSVNTGLANASAKIVLLISDYTYLPENCIEKHVNFHIACPAENIGYMCPHQYRSLPELHHEFIKYNNEDTELYAFHLKNRKLLNNILWSIFKYNFNQDPETLPLDDMGNADSKLSMSLGFGDQNAFNGKNESFKLEAALKINGFDEDLDGTTPFQDNVFADMLVHKLDFKWIVDKNNKVYIINPRFVMPWSKRLRASESNLDIWKRKCTNGYKDPINKWNLREVYNKNNSITQIYKKENSMDYFGRNFKIVDWHLLPGNNGADNPWDDEAPIRQKYWNSLTPGQVVIDVGACFGLYTLPALMQGCRVIAFEPNKEFSNIISESVAMNNFSDRYECHNIGIWNDSIFPEELAKPVLEWCKQKEPFITTTIDKITQNLNRVDIIKIDVEGAEAGALEGSVETIKKFRPSFLIEDHTGLYNYCNVNNTRSIIVSLLHNFNYNITVELFGGPPPPNGGRYFIIATPNK